MKMPTSEDFLQLLDNLYEKSLQGIEHVSPPIDTFALNYISRHTNRRAAAKEMLKNQIIKCTTSGVITGFGGAITLPVTIPANVGSVLYVQMRMIACTAYMGGYDLNDDQVQTFVYACLAGISVNSLLKGFGIKLGEKMFISGVKKIPGKALTKINQRIGFRFITKFGEKGMINLGKLVPGIGAAINGSLDYFEAKAIADRAYKMFINGDFSVGESIEA